MRMTQTNISAKRRLEIKNAVYDALVHSNCCNLPIKIKSIARSYKNIRLIAFSKHIKRLSISYEEMKAYAKTKDAFTDYYVNEDMFYIYYNDLDLNIVTSNRYRWNIAHELGHVLLNHHKNNSKTRIFRCALSDEEYNSLEAEADYFAQLLLVPHAALLGFHIKNSNHIKIMCKISGPASRKRYYEYVNWKSHIDAKNEYDNRIFHHYYSFIYKRRCKHCGAKLIQRYGMHCPICGRKTLEWGDGTMIYEKLYTYETGKLKECPTCKNEETSIDGDYCQICGNNLINRCSYHECTYNEPLPSNARYCPICGSESTFYRNGFLKEWNYKEQNPDSFMIVPDKIDEELPFS